MHQNLIKRVFLAVGFCLTFFLLVKGYFYLAANAVYSRAGLNTQEQLEMQFENAVSRKYSCVVLGNSRTYRGINPDLLSIPAYNFSHDNDNYNQIYWKLMYLEEEGVAIDSAIISTDYFMFSFLSDTRNEHYGSLLPEGYMEDYDESISIETEAEKQKWFERMNDGFNAYIVRKFQQPLIYIVETLAGEKTQERSLKSNGQYIDPFTVATDADTVQRDGNRLEIQMSYFEKVLSYCAQKGIRTAVVMPPARDIEMGNYTEEFLAEFDGYLESMTEKYHGILLNYAYDEDFKSTDLYTDSTHLCPTAADLWTKKLDADLKEKGFY